MKLVNLLIKFTSAQDSDDYVTEFERRGMIASAISSLKFKFINQDIVASQLLCVEPHPVNGLILTSPRSVEALAIAFDLLESRQRHQVLANLECDLIFVVGERTGQELKKRLSLDYNHGSGKMGSFENLAPYVATVCAERQQPVHLLFLRSSLSGSVIETHQAFKVTSIDCYHTQACENKRELILNVMKKLKLSNSLRELTTKSPEQPTTIEHSAQNQEQVIGEIVQVPSPKSILVINLVFFSPSAVKGLRAEYEDIVSDLAQLFPELSIKVVQSSIGRTTEKALEAHGYEVLAVAEHPTPVSLVDRISEVARYNLL